MQQDWDHTVLFHFQVAETCPRFARGRGGGLLLSFAVHGDPCSATIDFGPGRASRYTSGALVSQTMRNSSQNRLIVLHDSGWANELNLRDRARWPLGQHYVITVGAFGCFEVLTTDTVTQTGGVPDVGHG